MAYSLNRKRQKSGIFLIAGNGGAYWDWTSDPYDVNVVLSRWANAPFRRQIYASRKKI